MFIQERGRPERLLSGGIGDWKGREDEGPWLPARSPWFLADLRASVG